MRGTTWKYTFGGYQYRNYIKYIGTGTTIKVESKFLNKSNI